MRRFCILAVMVLFLLLPGCASKEDKEVAQKVMNEISDIGTVSLDKAEQIYAVKSHYQELTDTQKKLVENVEILSAATIEVEDLALEEETKNDPTNSIVEKDLVGIWKENSATTQADFFYFAQNGYVYFMSSQSTPSQSDFTSKYIIGTSYHIGDYNKKTKVKEGEFYCIANKSDIEFSVTKASTGNMVLIVKNSVAKGTYLRTGKKVEVTTSICQHSGCTDYAASTGDSGYCVEHSNRCLECDCYIDEDAMFCLNCIVEAIREIDE